MDRDKKVFELVKTIYENEETPLMGTWMWHNHVQWVANKTEDLANKYDANTEFAVSAALLHDLGDARYKRDDSKFNEQCEVMGYEVLEEAGFNKEEAKEIIEVIVQPHSCRPESLPTTAEGKVLATADALFHLQTNFFTVLCYANRPERLNSLGAWQEWFDEKIERDYKTKIFFEDEKQEALEDYNSLKLVFGNKTLEETKS